MRRINFNAKLSIPNVEVLQMFGKSLRKCLRLPIKRLKVVTFLGLGIVGVSSIFSLHAQGACPSEIEVSNDPSHTRRPPSEEFIFRLSTLIEMGTIGHSELARMQDALKDKVIENPIDKKSNVTLLRESHGEWEWIQRCIDTGQIDQEKLSKWLDKTVIEEDIRAQRAKTMIVGEIEKDADGYALVLDHYEAGQHCRKKYGTGLPSIRQLAEEAQNNGWGLKMFNEQGQPRHQEVLKKDGSVDFYFDDTDFHPTGEFADYGYWSSSIYPRLWSMSYIIKGPHFFNPASSIAVDIRDGTLLFPSPTRKGGMATRCLQVRKDEVTGSNSAKSIWGSFSNYLSMILH